MRVSPAWLYAMIDLRFYPCHQEISNIHHFKSGWSLKTVLPTHFAAYSVPGAFPAGSDDFSKSPLRWTVSSTQSGHFHSVLAHRNVERHSYLKNTSQICIELVTYLLWANPIPWPSSWPKLLMTKSNKKHLYHFIPFSSNSHKRGTCSKKYWTVKQIWEDFFYIFEPVIT